MSTDKPNDTLVQKNRILETLLKNISSYRLMMQDIEGKNTQDYCLTGKSEIKYNKNRGAKANNLSEDHRFYNLQEVFDSSVVNYARLHYNNLRFVEPISEKRADTNLLQLDQIALKRNIDRHLQELEVQNHLLPKFLQAVSDFKTRVAATKQEILNADLEDHKVVEKINFLLDKYLDRLNLVQTQGSDYTVKLNNLLLVFFLQLLQAQTQAEQNPRWKNWGTDFLNFIEQQDQLLELSLLGQARFYAEDGEERELADENIIKVNNLVQRLVSSDPFEAKEDLSLLYKFFKTDPELELNNPRGLDSKYISELSKQLSLAQAVKDSLIYTPAYTRAEISYITKSLKLAETGYTPRVNPRYYQLAPVPWSKFAQSAWFGAKVTPKRFFQYDNYSFNWGFDEQESLLLAIRHPDALKEYHWMQDLFVAQYVMQKFHYPLIQKEPSNLKYPYRKFYFKQEWLELENGVYSCNNLYPYSIKANFYSRYGKINDLITYLDYGVRFKVNLLTVRKLSYSATDDLLRRKDFKLELDPFFIKGAYSEFKQALDLEQGKKPGKFIYPVLPATAIFEHDPQVYNVPRVQYYAQLAERSRDPAVKSGVESRISYLYLQSLTTDINKKADPFVYTLLSENLSQSEQAVTARGQNPRAKNFRLASWLKSTGQVANLGATESLAQSTEAKFTSGKPQEVYYRKQDLVDTYGLYGFNYQAYVAHRNGKQILRFRNYLENPLNFKRKLDVLHDQTKTLGESILVPIYTPKLFSIPIYNGEEGLLAKSFISEEQYFKGQNSIALIYSRFESNITYDLFETLSSREVEVLAHRYYQEPSLQLASLDPDSKILANVNVELAVSLYHHLRGIFSALNRIKYYSDKLPKASFLRSKEKTQVLNPTQQLLPADILVLELSLGVKALEAWHHPADLPMSELNIYPGYKYSLTAEVELNQQEFLAPAQIAELQAKSLRLATTASKSAKVTKSGNKGKTLTTTVSSTDYEQGYLVEADAKPESGYFLLQPRTNPSNFALVHLSVEEATGLIQYQSCFSNSLNFNPEVLRNQYYRTNANSYFGNTAFLADFRARMLSGLDSTVVDAVRELLTDNERCFTLVTALYDLGPQASFFGKNIPTALQWKFLAEFANEPLDKSWFAGNLAEIEAASYNQLGQPDSSLLAALQPAGEEYYSSSLKPLTTERHWKKFTPLVEKFTVADFYQQYQILGKIENLQISASEGIEGDIIRTSHPDNMEYDRYLSFVGANSLKNLHLHFTEFGWLEKIPAKCTAEQWHKLEQDFICQLAGNPPKVVDNYKRLLNLEWYQRLDRQYVNFIPLGARPVRNPNQRSTNISYQLVFPSYSYLEELHKQVLKSPVQALKLYGNNLWLNYDYLAPLTALAMSRGEEVEFTQTLYQQVGTLLLTNQSYELLNEVALNIAGRINRVSNTPYQFTESQLARFKANLKLLQTNLKREK